MERNPTLAMFHLFVECFVAAVGLFAAVTIPLAVAAVVSEIQ